MERRAHLRARTRAARARRLLASGPRARPCNIEWIRSIIKQCKEAAVQVFVKQLGADPYFPRADEKHLYKPIRDRKGGDATEWPPDLRIREFPLS